MKTLALVAMLAVTVVVGGVALALLSGPLATPAVVGATFAIATGPGGALPTGLVGRWEGPGRVIVTWCGRKEIPVVLEIRPDGTVTGTVGDAVLRNGRFQANRGAIGRRLNLATDWIVTGGLDGPLVRSEGIVRRSVTMPVDLREGRLDGAVHSSGWLFGGKKLMMFTARVALERDASQTPPRSDFHPAPPTANPSPRRFPPN